MTDPQAIGWGGILLRDQDFLVVQEKSKKWFAVLERSLSGLCQVGTVPELRKDLNIVKKIKLPPAYETQAGKPNRFNVNKVKPQIPSSVVG